MEEVVNKTDQSEEHLDVQADTIQKIDLVLSKLSVDKIYFIDDAINLTTTDKATFLGLVQKVLAAGKIADLKKITLQNAIDFNTDEEVLIDHVNAVWDNINPGKQVKYYKHIYTIDGNPEAITDLNVSHHLNEFFNNGKLVSLTPTQWDEQRDEILNAIPADKKILVLFDQDLKLAPGRFTDQNIKGEHLITELIGLPNGEKVIIGLLTHTITSCDEELSERQTICQRVGALTEDKFFVLAKARLEKPEQFGDGIKKTCLNTYCEDIKTQTIGILEVAQAQTIAKLRTFDTYDFDHTVFKSSFGEGVWEPETLLRITDVIFKDEVRKLMIERNYVPLVNTSICAASEISDIPFAIDAKSKTYSEKIKLRHQEIYESESLLNNLRRPIDNGDIFEITGGQLKNKKYILVAQECDLMVRGGTKGDEGTRGARIAILLPIKILASETLLSELKRKYSADIKKGKFTTHFYADKFKLEYFESGTTKVGIVDLSSALSIDLNVLDLIVFNDTGDAVLDLAAPTFDEKFHNFAWRIRYEKISKEFTEEAKALESLYSVLPKIADPTLENEIQEKINRLLSFIVSAGIQINYKDNKFNFGLKRISRLRVPKSKYLLDRYYQHLSREAEPHDFVISDNVEPEVTHETPHPEETIVAEEKKS